MKALLTVFALLTAGCRAEAPPAPTAQEAEQLNEAEDLLNGLGNEEGPAPDGTGPSD